MMQRHTSTASLWRQKFRLGTRLSELLRLRERLTEDARSTQPWPEPPKLSSTGGEWPEGPYLSLFGWNLRFAALKSKLLLSPLQADRESLTSQVLRLLQLVCVR